MKKRIVNKLILSRGYTDLVPCSCGYHKTESSHSFGPAVRKHWLLHYVSSGKGTFTSPRGTFEVNAGEIFIIKPFEVNYYEADRDNPWEYYWVGFTTPMSLPSVLMNEDRIYAPYLKNVFGDAFMAPDSSEGAKGYEDYLVGKIWEILSRLRRESGDSELTAEQHVRAAIDLMESEYAMGIDVGGIAKRLHVNRSYFTELFTKALNVSPGAYLTKLRMDRAASLLENRAYSIAVVAASVGYSDPFVFSRAFKSYFGIAPKSYREKFKP